jgi:hypothetical protein
MAFENLSKYLNKPIDNNLTEDGYNSAVNDTFTQNYKKNDENKIKNNYHSFGGDVGAKVFEDLKNDKYYENKLRNLRARESVHDTYNGLLDSYKKDKGLNDKDFENDLVKNLHLSNVEFIPKEGLQYTDAADGMFVPPAKYKVPDMLARQFVPTKIYFDPKAQYLNHTKLHELEHIRDFKDPMIRGNYGGSENVTHHKYEDKYMHPNWQDHSGILGFFRDAFKKPVPPEDEKYDFQSTDESVLNSHISNESQDEMRKYVFNRIQELLGKK